MTDELARCIVRRDASIRDALDAIDRGAGGIVLVVDEGGRLVAIATDGDLRRALLAGRALDDPLGDRGQRAVRAPWTPASRGSMRWT